MSAVPLAGTALPPQNGVAWLPPSSEPRTSQSAVKNTMAGGTPMIGESLPDLVVESIESALMILELGPCQVLLG